MKRVIAAALTVLLVSVVTRAQDDEDWLKKIDRKLALKVSVNFQEEPLYKALDFFRKRGEINVVLDADDTKVSEKRITLKLEDVRLESAIAWTARLLDLEYAVKNEAVFLTTRDNMPAEWRNEMQERYRRAITSGQESWLMNIEKHLDRKVKVDFRNQPLGVVADVLAIEGGVNVVLDRELEQSDKRVKLQVEMSLKNILDWVCRLAEVKYAIRDEVIYIATQKRLDALRLETGESALALLFRRPVSFDFKNTPVDEALDRLSRLSRVEIKLQGLKPGEKLTVTAKGEKVELSRAVRAVMDGTGRTYAVSHRGTSILVMVSPKPSGKTATDAKKTGD